MQNQTNGLNSSETWLGVVRGPLVWAKGLIFVRVLQWDPWKQSHALQNCSISVLHIVGNSSGPVSSHILSIKMHFQMASKHVDETQHFVTYFFFPSQKTNTKILVYSVSACLSHCPHFLFLCLNFLGSPVLHFLAPHVSAQMIYTYTRLDICSLWTELNWAPVQKWKCQELLWLPKLQLRSYDLHMPHCHLS